MLSAHAGRYKPNDPFASLQRDGAFTVAPDDDNPLRALYHSQLSKLEQLVQQQRNYQKTLIVHLRNAQYGHSNVSMYTTKYLGFKTTII